MTDTTQPSQTARPPSPTATRWIWSGPRRRRWTLGWICERELREGQGGRPPTSPTESSSRTTTGARNGRTAVEVEPTRKTGVRVVAIRSGPESPSGPKRAPISFSSDGGGGAVICSGDGDDVVDTIMTSRIHTGSGYDRVNEYLQCGGTAEVLKAEIVRVRYDAESEGFGYSSGADIGYGLRLGFTRR